MDESPPGSAAPASSGEEFQALAVMGRGWRLVLHVNTGASPQRETRGCVLRRKAGVEFFGFGLTNFLECLCGEAHRWLVPTTSSRGTVRGQVQLSLVSGGGGLEVQGMPFGNAGRGDCEGPPFCCGQRKHQVRERLQSVYQGREEPRGTDLRALAKAGREAHRRPGLWGSLSYRGLSGSPGP